MRARCDINVITVFQHSINFVKNLTLQLSTGKSQP